MNEDVEFKPIVSFTDQSPNFTLGFEAGMIWQQMQALVSPIESGIPYRTENKEVVRRMANASGYIISSESDAGDGWIYITLERREEPKAGRFRVIDGGLSTN